MSKANDILYLESEIARLEYYRDRYIDRIKKLEAGLKEYEHDIAKLKTKIEKRRDENE